MNADLSTLAICQQRRSKDVRLPHLHWRIYHEPVKHQRRMQLVRFPMRCAAVLIWEVTYQRMPKQQSCWRGAAFRYSIIFHPSQVSRSGQTLGGWDMRWPDGSNLQQHNAGFLAFDVHMTHFGSSTSLNRPSIRDHPIQLGRLHSLKTRRGGKDGVAAGRIFGQEMDIQEATAANISTKLVLPYKEVFIILDCGILWVGKVKIDSGTPHFRSQRDSVLSLRKWNLRFCWVPTCWCHDWKRRAPNFKKLIWKTTAPWKGGVQEKDTYFLGLLISVSWFFRAFEGSGSVCFSTSTIHGQKTTSFGE